MKLLSREAMRAERNLHPKSRVGHTQHRRATVAGRLQHFDPPLGVHQSDSPRTDLSRRAVECAGGDQHSRRARVESRHARDSYSRPDQRLRWKVPCGAPAGTSRYAVSRVLTVPGRTDAIVRDSEPDSHVREPGARERPAALCGYIGDDDRADEFTEMLIEFDHSAFQAPADEPRVGQCLADRRQAQERS